MKVLFVFMVLEHRRRAAGDKIRRPRFLVARDSIWFGIPYGNTLKFTFAQFPSNNGVEVCIVHNDETRGPPADRTFLVGIST
jgi:hypothetical protein